MPDLPALLVKQIVKRLRPLGFVGPLGYQWWSIGDEACGEVCRLVVFPTPNEAQGGQHDGATYVNGFVLDLGGLLSVFTGAPLLTWRASVELTPNLGPELEIRGVFAGQPVWLTIRNIPPDDEEPVYKVNQVTGEVKPR